MTHTLSHAKHPRRPRLYPDVVYRKDVKCQSDRSPNFIDRIVIHDTEGANIPGIRDFIGLGEVFNHPEIREASAHVGTDQDGHSARYVADEKKSWACMTYNSRSLNIEQIGFAVGYRWQTKQYRETARWVAHWSIKYGIPIDAEHVVTHQSLGAIGGGHSDPGVNYNMPKLRRMARRRKVAMLAHQKLRRNHRANL